VPAFLALLVKNRIPQLRDSDEWKTLCSFNALDNYDFLIQAYPLCFTILSSPPFIFWLLSVLVPGNGQSIQFSKKRSIAIEYSPSIKFILMHLQLSGLSYPHAVNCMKWMVHAMLPAMRHVLMTLIDRVDDFIKLGSSIAQKMCISLISINVRISSIGGRQRRKGSAQQS
jgi:hypothetical protein